MAATRHAVPGRPVIVRFRRDLRLSDHPALSEAAARGVPVVPVYIHDPEEGESGAASRLWLHRSLAALAEELARRGSRLIVRRGDAANALSDLARETGAGAVFWSRLFEPGADARDARLASDLAASGIEARSFGGALLHDPGEMRTGAGGPFKVFTPFWNRLAARLPPPTPLPAPRRIAAPAAWPSSLDVGALGLEPEGDRASGIRAAWRFGEAGARERLSRFLEEAVGAYAGDRDRPDRPGTSRLSPSLHFGELSPGQAWHAVQGRIAADPSPGTARGGEAFLRQLAWREFARHLLHHFPRTVAEPLREEFAAFPWREDRQGLEAWRAGMTGFPFVDAGMRQLRETGWMHNRVRMVVASFLTKDLLVPWQEGAAGFLDALVDADRANNTLGWQWVAGCGADAAPYFRVFNPASQGARFDPEGAYVRKWIRELSGLPAEWIHRPWEAPGEVLRSAGVVPGRTYPRPLLDHGAARVRALAAYGTVRRRGEPEGRRPRRGGKEAPP